MAYNLEYPYSEKTKEMFKLIPGWMKMARDKESIGQQFMNFFGLQFEDIEEILDDMLDNRFLISTELSQPDIIYKFDLPAVYIPEAQLIVKGAGKTLTEQDTLKDFYNNSDSYIIDYDKLIAYCSDSYDTNENPGQIEVIIKNKGRELYNNIITLELHHVWNSLDEFGLLLDLPRIRGERNSEYQKRLLDVFRYPANSTKTGLTFGIARELGLIRHEEWQDDTKPFTIDRPQILANTIKIDGKDIKDDQYIKWDDGENNSAIKILPFNTGNQHDISYISQIEIHALNDKKDIAFEKQLYKSDGTATDKLKYYVNLITSDIPIMWGSFIWDVSWWDSADKDLSGIEFLPNIWDPDIENWSNYR